MLMDSAGGFKSTTFCVGKPNHRSGGAGKRKEDTSSSVRLGGRLAAAGGKGRT